MTEPRRHGLSDQGRASCPPLVELLWFEGCANHRAARRLLEDVLASLASDAAILEIDASDREVAVLHQFPGSPTIRIDGRDVDPSFRDPGDYSPRCRLYWTSAGLRGVPERAWIEAALLASSAGGWAGRPPGGIGPPLTDHSTLPIQIAGIPGAFHIPARPQLAPCRTQSAPNTSTTGARHENGR